MASLGFVLQFLQVYLCCFT